MTVNPFVFTSFLIMFSMRILPAAVYTVAKDGSGTHTTIQAAVDAARPYDEIVIEDTEVYEEQVTIDSTKNGLWLHSVNPYDVVKPVIRFRDTINIHPVNSDEAKDVNFVNFDRNGALQILGAEKVRIEGIAVDGVEPGVYGAEMIWPDGRGPVWPLQFGTGAIVVWMAGETFIRFCDVSNAYYGINIKDRNVDGIFALPNQSDIDSGAVLTFAGAGTTGNHLIENNRIHNNSNGIYVESAWDGGSTIRYNLLYENHHYSDTFAEKVRELTSEGPNMPGGAITTKDHLLAPLAIHNNTFWHNRMIFAGQWKSGGQHLVFNNIYSLPHQYLEDDEVYSPSNFLDMMPTMSYRMHNCSIAAQQTAPANLYTIISPDFSIPIKEGDLLSKPFPESAEIRYLETPFLSTIPEEKLFLTPDWTDSNVQNFVVDNGWDAAGVKDGDGSRADIGAVSLIGHRNEAVAVIRPIGSAMISGTSAVLEFVLAPRIGDIVLAKITYLGAVLDLDTNDCFAGQYRAIPTEQVVTLPTDGIDVRAGVNRIETTLPSSPGNFAFFEMLIEGEDAFGNAYTTATGFIPYRRTDYRFSISVQEPDSKETCTVVYMGKPVNLHVEVVDSAEERIKDTVALAFIRSGLGEQLHTPEGEMIDTLRELLNGEADVPVVFNSLPLHRVEVVSIAGLIKGNPVIGVSDTFSVIKYKTGIGSAATRKSHFSQQVTEYEMIDLRGKVVKQIRCRKVLSHEMSEFGNIGRGMYMLRVVKNGRVSFRKRVVLR